MHPRSEKPVLVSCLKESLERTRVDYKTANQNMQKKEGRERVLVAKLHSKRAEHLWEVQAADLKDSFGAMLAGLYTLKTNNCLLWLPLPSELNKVFVLLRCDTISLALVSLNIVVTEIYFRSCYTYCCYSAFWMNEKFGFTLFTQLKSLKPKLWSVLLFAHGMSTTTSNNGVVSQDLTPIFLKLWF